MKALNRHHAVTTDANVVVGHNYKDSVLPVGAGLGLGDKFAKCVVGVFDSIVIGTLGSE